MHIIDNITVKEMFPLFKLRQLKPQEYQMSNLEEEKGFLSAHLFFEQAFILDTPSWNYQI